MYTSTEDARSDLFLSGAVFLFGGVILRVLLNIVPLGRIPGVAPLLQILLPLVTTLLVPYLLIRYRGESWSLYGLQPVSAPALGYGALVGLPVAVAFVLAGVLSGLPPTATVPLAGVGGQAAVELLARVTQWLGYVGLAVYGTVKARDAFRGQHRTLREGAQHIGRILALAVVVAGVLLLLAMAARGGLTADPLAAVGVVLPALGVAGAAAVVLARLQGSATTTLPTLVTPTVLLGLAAFVLVFDPVGFVNGVYQAGLFAALGLIVGVLMESRRSAWAAIGLAMVIATLSTLGAGATLR